MNILRCATAVCATLLLAGSIVAVQDKSTDLPTVPVKLLKKTPYYIYDGGGLEAVFNSSRPVSMLTAKQGTFSCWSKTIRSVNKSNAIVQVLVNLRQLPDHKSSPQSIVFADAAKAGTKLTLANKQTFSALDIDNPIGKEFAGQEQWLGLGVNVAFFFEVPATTKKADLKQIAIAIMAGPSEKKNTKPFQIVLPLPPMK